MLLDFEKGNYERIKCSVILAAKLFLSSLILLHFGAIFIVANRDIPFCDELWNDLGKDLADWRERCFEGDSEIDTPCCHTDKEYFKERRRNHKKMCFYEGNRLLLVVLIYRIILNRIILFMIDGLGEKVA
jgi:hypothetical protein